MKNADKTTEVDLAAVVVDYLESKDWDVYQEVSLGYSGQSADILAVKNNEIWVIETKTSLSFAVIAQAIKWHVTYRSVAVPYARRTDGRSLAFLTCQKFDVGVLEVYVNDHNVKVTIDAEKIVGTDHQVAAMLKALTPYHKNGVAGSLAGGAITPYKVTMMKVKEFIHDNPGCTLNDIVDSLGKCHYSHVNSAKNGIRTALSTWENWCVVRWDRKKGNVYFIKEDVQL